MTQNDPHSDEHRLPFPEAEPPVPLPPSDAGRTAGSDAANSISNGGASRDAFGSASQFGVWMRRAKRAAMATGMAGAAFGALMAYYTLTLPHPFKAEAQSKTPVIRIVARDGTLLAERGRPHDYIPVHLLPKHVVGAVIATEDRRFHEHWGIDPYGMIRASLTNLRRGRVVQGGSTLTQQLAKNLFLSHERTMGRKAEELALALWLELRLTKREILELYLNRVYLGAGAYGVEAAAQKYFGKSARALDVTEAAVIAGLLQAPSRYSPLRNPKLARARAQVVLRRMRSAGVISEASARKALQDVPQFAEERGLKPSDANYGYAIDHVLEAMPSLTNDDSGILIVETTIDARLQKHAQAKLRTRLQRRRKNAVAPQGAVVVLDPDGAIRAIVGGRHYINSQFNRATKAKRQPGSAFKPFVYLAALADGYTPQTQVLDLPISVNGWSPRNSNGKFSGAISLGDSLARSVNTVAVRLQQQTGGSAVVSMARKFGIASELRADPTLALGTSEVTPIELTAAYSALANGGQPVQPHIVTRIRTHLGRVLFAHQPSRSTQQIEGPTIGQINRMLQAVVTSGTGRRAQIDRHDIAGKTGTTQDGRDAWFVGYSSHLTTGVWVGYDDGNAREKLSGATLPALVFRDVMSLAHADLPPQPIVWTRDADVVAGRMPARKVSVGVSGTSASMAPLDVNGGARRSASVLAPADWPTRKPEQLSRKSAEPLNAHKPRVMPVSDVAAPQPTVRRTIPRPFFERMLSGSPGAEPEAPVIVPTTTLQGIRRDADRGPLTSLIEKISSQPKRRTAVTSGGQSRMSLGRPENAGANAPR